ncbi:Dicer-like protein [Lachnellula hyalina]|uniref:Dicer-like protein 1 n=1 Tax=Lachnellula hyalina TaxID=1316788 RepID=A0A8H8R0J9_9HELO|nr:Dicer-like protein [Lachnellula hyalina]TVY25861.1 Dicer-like protein [Lachnellula hyalina]
MPLSGYLHDLSLLAGEDCLLVSPPKKTALIVHSPEAKASCSPSLTAGTLSDMMLLDNTSIFNNREAAHKADEKAEFLRSEFTPPTSNIKSTENNPYIFSLSSTTKSSSTSNLAPTTTKSLVDVSSWLNPTISQAASPRTPQQTTGLARPFLRKENDPLSSPGAIPAVKTSPLPAFTPLQESTNSTLPTPPLFQVTVHPSGKDRSAKMHGYHAVDHELVQQQLGSSSDEQISRMLANQEELQGSSDVPLLISNEDSIVVPAKESLPQLTALTARSTKAVIAELRQKHHNPLSLHLPTSKLVSIGPLPSLSSISSNGRSAPTRDDRDDDEAPAEDPDDDEDEDDQPKGRSRKITERKRRQNAIADSYLRDALQDPVKNHKLLPQDEANQSTRYIVHQAESQRIISTPREYQIELFERAKEKNIIAVLDTGSGKTLIAVLLLRNIFNQELEDRALGKPKRISFFLVDSVTLVFQQHAVLNVNLDQPMNMFCGEMGCDLWSKKLWEKHFNENMVIVCTAEVLRQCLHHSFISIEQINLLIFDEAHHAKKDHAYARIIKDFYATAPKSAVLPKIFGMTASPVDARVDVKKAAAELETMLHAEIATAADTSLSQYAATSKLEQLATYGLLGSSFMTPLYDKMRQRFKGNAILRKPLEYSYKIASRELGSWCADHIFKFCLAGEESNRLLGKTERQYHAKKVPGPIAILEQQKSQLQEALDIIKLHPFEPPDFDLATLSSKNLSSKVVLLAKYLKERYERPTEDKCIVFVKQRYTARLLTTLFSHPTMKTPHLFVASLVGTRTGDAADLHTSVREQVVTMMNFRKGTTNCLFATSVAEEGLDVPDCNLVIRFDLYDTTIQYIQSRGRARHANSRYIHMAESGNQVHHQLIREARLNEGILKKFCNELPENRKLTGNDYNMDHFLSEEKSHRVYINPETGAKLTYKIGLSVLANFVDSLPHSHETNLQAEYVITAQNKMFVGEVIMPEESPIRGSTGRPASTKQVAKCSAAFETCLNLVASNYLDKHLLPTYTRQLPAMRNALLAVDSKKEAYDMKTKPALWSVSGVPGELYVTIMSLDNPEVVDRPLQPMALLTRSRLPELPSFVLHFGQGRNSPVQLTSLRSCIQVDPAIISQVNKFTLCIFDDVFSKEYESDVAKMPYFLAPVNQRASFDREQEPFSLIAWDILKIIEDHSTLWEDKGWEKMKPWQTEPDEFFEDKFVTDPFDGSRKLWLKGVTREYKATDPVPSNTAPRKARKGRPHDNIMEYSCSLWEKARARRVLDENQRVFAAEVISLRRNLLDEFSISESQASDKCFVTLETLKVSPIPSTIVFMANLLPAIIHRTESYLIALEACDLLHLKIRPDLALEAVTKDSDNTDEHSAEKFNFQRGMGNNYERLEFLGDCFLKMATTIALYGIHPGHDEYEYHVDRMLLICNKNLKNNAFKIKLYEYIRSQSFNRRAWYPEGLVLKKGKTATAPNTQKLGDKTIADVCEAFIGAALLTCYESGDMDNAVRAVTELVSSENHNISSYSQYYTLYEKPKYQMQVATESQKDLARQVEKEHNYHFRWPRVLGSAFVHPSYPFSYEQIPSYQRLEFLGDALLDMACINFLFHNYPGKDPQWLTEHKMAMVSNQYLGALCVSLGFHRHLLLFNASFQKQISDYVTEITEARKQAEEDAIHAGKTAAEFSPDYWISVRQPPKCLPDIVEAYVGALFVDSEYNYAEIERFFDEHIKPYFTDMSIYDTYANKHPATFLANFLQVNMGCMDWTIMAKEVKSVDGSKPGNMAMVMIHDRIIADAQAGSARYSKVAAAKKALEILKGLPSMEFREKYGCCCRPGADEEQVEQDEQEPDHGTAA